MPSELINNLTKDSHTVGPIVGQCTTVTTAVYGAAVDNINVITLIRLHLSTTSDPTADDSLYNSK